MDMRKFREGDTAPLRKDLVTPVPSDEALLGLGGDIFTLLHDDTPVGILAISLICPGVAEAWSILTDSAREHTVSLPRTSRLIIDHAFRNHRLHRMQAIIFEDELAQGQLSPDGGDRHG